ncbi:L,D-transpeptidase family protein [Nocardioides sp.]|uniref:L,D-transpeptidase family protein n=1 Tax=Nocardioides sp. TaxID=35761 RepID=UPI003563A30D
MTLLRRLVLGLLTALVLVTAAVVGGLAVSGTTLGTHSAAPPVARPVAAPAPVPAPSVPARPAPSTEGQGVTRSPRTPVRPQEPGRPLLAPGAEGVKVRNLQARLRQIAWYFGDVTGTYAEDTAEAVRGFQAKRGLPVTGSVDQRTLDRLHQMTTEPTRFDMYEQGNRPGPLDARCKVGRVLCVDKSTRTLRWVVDGEVKKTVDVRFGASYTPTREGEFSVQYMSRNHVSSLYDSSMPFAMFFSGGQAVHYSSDFAATGYAGASHGCVNVRDYDAIAWLFDQVSVGDKVVVYWS